MQDLASEFSKFFRGWYPGPSQREGTTTSRTQHPVRPLAGRGAQAPRCWDGTQTLVLPQLFSRGCAPDVRTRVLIWSAMRLLPFFLLHVMPKPFLSLIYLGLQQ